MRLASTASLKFSPSPSNAHGPLLGGDSDIGFISASKKAILECAIWRLIDDLNGTLGYWNNGHNCGDRRRFKANERASRGQIFRRMRGTFQVVRDRVVVTFQTFGRIQCRQKNRLIRYPSLKPSGCVSKEGERARSNVFSAFFGCLRFIIPVGISLAQYTPFRHISFVNSLDG